MEKKLITEIRRISELIGVDNNTLLNEGLLGKLFGQALEQEIETLIRMEVRNALKTGVKVVEQDAETLAKAEAKVLAKVGGKKLTNAQSKGIQAEMKRLSQEEAQTIVRKKGSTSTLTAAEKEAYEKLAAAEKSRLGAKSLGQGTREKLIQKVTSSGKNVTLKSTKVPRNITDKIKQSMREAALISLKQKWNWARWLKWGVVGGLSALAVWWLIANWGGEEDIVPEDIPKTDEDLTDDNNGDFPLEEGAYTTPGDPYQYKVVECVWFTKSWKNRGKIIKDWISLSNNKKATDILDGRHPDARKNCNGNTTPPVVTTGSTSTQDVVNQQFGVTPQPNAQPEVQTTNDDINNY